MNLAQVILTLALRVYRRVLSPALTAVFAPLGFGCRFEPTCSAYALGAIQRHGALKGTALAAWRVCRCHPFGGSGHDPVPERTAAERTSSKEGLRAWHRKLSSGTTPS